MKHLAHRSEELSSDPRPHLRTDTAPFACKPRVPVEGWVAGTKCLKLVG